MESDVSTLKDHKDDNDMCITDVQGAISTADGRADDRRSDLDTLKGTIAAVAARIVTLEADYPDLDEDADDYVEDV